MKDTISRLVEEGKTTREIAEIVGLSIHGVRYHREKSRRGGSRITEHRRRVKRKAINYSGDKCLKCAYNRCDRQKRNRVYSR